MQLMLPLQMALYSEGAEGFQILGAHLMGGINLHLNPCCNKFHGILKKEANKQNAVYIRVKEKLRR